MGPFDTIGLVAVLFAAVKIFGPVGSALARRLGGRPEAHDAHVEIGEMDARMTAEMDDLRNRLAEVEERLDFAERLLARGGEADQIRGGAIT